MYTAAVTTSTTIFVLDLCLTCYFVTELFSIRVVPESELLGIFEAELSPSQINPLIDQLLINILDLQSAIYGLSKSSHEVSDSVSNNSDFSWHLNREIPMVSVSSRLIRETVPGTDLAKRKSHNRNLVLVISLTIFAICGCVGVSETRSTAGRCPSCVSTNSAKALKDEKLTDSSLQNQMTKNTVSGCYQS